MKKGGIWIGILVVVALTGWKLYQRAERAELKAQQEEELRRQGEELLYKQKEAKILEIKKEEKRINDSIANAQRSKMDEGRQMLKEALENLK